MQSVNAPVRIGMIGCGGFARYHLANLTKLSDAKVVALCDPNPDQFDRCLDIDPRLAEATRFFDYRTLLHSEDVDSVVIVTPHTQHADQIMHSLDAGKHVLCEKPLVTNVPDARKVLAKFKEKNLIGMIGYQRHQQAEFQRIRQMVQEERYGKVTYIAAYLSQEWKRFTKGTWRQDPALSGGGQLNDSGSHLIDIMLWTTGLVPEIVTCFKDNRGTEVDIDSGVLIRFEGGAMGSITVVGDAPNWHEDFTLTCERGAFFIRNGKLTIVEHDGSRIVCEHLFAPSTNSSAHFVNCILGREQPLAPFDCGLGVIQLTEAAWKSAEQGGAPVRVADLG